MSKLTPFQQRMLDTWQQHGHAEFVLKDPDAAIATMCDDPCIIAPAINQRTIGRQAVHAYYKYDFLPHIPPDFQFIPISRCIGENMLADEFLIRYTHSIDMFWQIPDVPATGRKVELPMVVFVAFKEDARIAYEHILWDHGSQLAQVGVLDQPAAQVGVKGAGGLLEWYARNRHA